MKKLIVLLLVLVLLVAMTGCGGKNDSANRTQGQTSTVEDVIEQGIAEEDGTATEEEPEPEDEPVEEPEGADPEDGGTEEGSTVDVDLTAMSSTMVYSEVNAMMLTPDDYLGKTVKMEGNFAVYYDEPSDTYYYACIVQDATQCCSQGIEFILTDAGERTFPEDYPVEGQIITVVGVFDTYIEGDFQYCTLREAVLV